jgi:hypothetical protein
VVSQQISVGARFPTQDHQSVKQIRPGTIDGILTHTVSTFRRVADGSISIDENTGPRSSQPSA